MRAVDCWAQSPRLAVKCKDSIGLCMFIHRDSINSSMIEHLIEFLYD
jgi:hypothetical protein